MFRLKEYFYGYCNGNMFRLANNVTFRRIRKNVNVIEKISSMFLSLDYLLKILGLDF